MIPRPFGLFGLFLTGMAGAYRALAGTCFDRACRTDQEDEPRTSRPSQERGGGQGLVLGRALGRPFFLDDYNEHSIP